MGTTDNTSAAGAVDAIKSKSSGMNSGLSASVGIGGINRPDDVQTVSSTLHANGLMDAPQSTADNSLFTGITKAQENMDWSLKRDGLVKPGGPTEQRFQHLAGQGFVKRAEPTPTASKTEQPTRAPGELPAPRSDARPDVAKAVERHNAQARAEARHQASLERQRQERAQAAEVKQARDMARNQASLQAQSQAQSQAATAKQAKTPLRTPLPYEDAADNQRTADALGNYKGVGDLPRFTVDAVNTDGAKAINEIADLHERVAARDPGQADELLSLTRDGITEARREAFDAMFRRDLKLEPKTQTGTPQAAPEPAHAYTQQNRERPERAPVINTADAAREQKDIFGAISSAHGSKTALDAEAADDLKARIDKAMPYDEELRLRAKSLVDAAKAGNWSDQETGLTKVRDLMNDPGRAKAASASADYYAKVPEDQRLANMDKRGELRADMEGHVTAMLENQAGIVEQQEMIARHRPIAQTGDPNSKRIVQAAEADLMRRLEQHKELSGKVAGLASEYHGIPSHPAPDVDTRAGRQEDAAENRNRTRKDVAVDAVLVAGGFGAGALAKRGVAGAAAAASTVKATQAAATFSREIRDGVARSMRESGVDFKNPSAVAEWVRSNPKMLAKINNEAYAKAATEAFAGHVAGKATQNIPSPFNIPAEMAVERGLNSILSGDRQKN